MNSFYSRYRIISLFAYSPCATRKFQFRYAFLVSSSRSNGITFLLSLFHCLLCWLSFIIEVHLSYVWPLYVRPPSVHIPHTYSTHFLYAHFAHIYRNCDTTSRSLTHSLTRAHKTNSADCATGWQLCWAAQSLRNKLANFYDCYDQLRAYGISGGAA